MYELSARSSSCDIVAQARQCSHDPSSEVPKRQHAAGLADLLN